MKISIKLRYMYPKMTSKFSWAFTRSWPKNEVEYFLGAGHFGAKYFEVCITWLTWPMQNFRPEMGQGSGLLRTACLLGTSWYFRYKFRLIHYVVPYAHMNNVRHLFVDEASTSVSSVSIGQTFFKLCSCSFLKSDPAADTTQRENTQRENSYWNPYQLLTSMPLIWIGCCF